MRAAVFHGAHSIAIEEAPVPEPEPDEALIRVRACGLCGSDLAAYKTGMYSDGVIIGHEFAGEIVRVGSAVYGLQAGDRVTLNDIWPCGECWFCQHNRHSQCQELRMPDVTHNGAFAEFTTAPARELLCLPDNISYRQAALAEPVANGLHAVRLSGLKAGDRVLVQGAGPIGLCALQAARLAGARAVYVAEVSPVRAAVAARLGADAVINPLQSNIFSRVAELTEGRGPDIIFECAGVPQTLQDDITLVRKGGEIFIIALCETPVEADFMTVVLNELTIRGGYAAYEEEAMALDFISQGRVDVLPLISHVIRLEELVSGGFDYLLKPGNDAVKILVEFPPGT